MMLIEEAVTYLFGLRKFGKQTGIVREAEVLKRLKHPEESLKIIHVAGTNGKGSVCAYLEQILRTQGYRTGLFTSPHLVRVNERIKIDNIEITDECFMKAFEQVLEVSEAMKADGMEGIAFFDFLMAMAMLIFREQKVDYVIMETGLGGRLDCTNAVKNPVLTVITSISFDHTEILGDTIGEIAAEKAGIIKEQIPLVFWDDKGESAQVIRKTAQDKHAPVYAVSENDLSICERNRKKIDFLFNNRYYKNSAFSIATMALYQVSNCALALMAAALLSDGNPLWEENVHEAVWKTFWSGRMEEVRQSFYVDGAHNADGIRVFLQTAGEITARHRYLLFSAVCEKDYDRMIRTICESGIFDGYIITKLDSHRALMPEVIKEEFERYTKEPVILEQNVKAALERIFAMQEKEDVWFAAGSLYLVGEIKALL